MSDEKLKPCPFCGEVPEYTSSTRELVRCVSYGCHNKGEYQFEKWNKRPIEDGLNFEYFDLLKMYEKDMGENNE